MPDSPGIEELPPLSDEDINILFNIVSTAQKSHHAPFRALFSAYDQILAENGIAPEHDQRFFRYLLRLGEGGAYSTSDLVLRLRRLLAKLDIHIVVNEDEDDVEFEKDVRGEEGSRNSEEAEQGSARSRRRASFNDTRLDETWLSGARLEAAQSGRSAHTSLDELRALGHQRPAHAALDAAQSRGRIAANPRPHTRSRSLSTQGSVRIARPAHRDHHQTRHAPVSDSLSGIPSSPPVLPTSHPLPHPDAEPTESDMVSEAEVFHHMSLVKSARQCLRQWQQASIRLRDLGQVAENHDHRLLKAQAFSIWAAKIAEKRQTAETERFFDHYERRATRARDLFLLNKAFTHWAQCTSDEVARTSVAQRHILRTRYFNAWRDITAVNDLKCRRLGLRKWFSVWRAKNARKAVDNDRAVAIYQEHLVERIYWKWFWEFCERKAPIWHDHRVRAACMHRLADAMTRYRQHETAALRLRNANLLRTMFGRLTARRNAIQSLDQIANHHRQTSLVSNCLHKLHQESKLGHASKQLSVTVSKRLLSTAVSVWQHNTELSQQAASANRKRLLQNAWTSWNDALRTRALSERIDDRVILENLYKWVLQSRLALFKRVMDTRLQQRVLQKLSLKLAEQRFRLDEANLIFQEHQRRRTLAAVMLKFHGKSRTEEMLERQALEFRNTRAVNAVMPVWTQKMQHLQVLNRWSKDARFYCLTTAAIKKWRDATTQVKRNKRREAYVTVRRRVKLRMVHDCFNIWQEKAATVKQIEEQANERSLARLMSARGATFGVWRERARQSIELSLQAELFRAQLLFLQTISVLTTKGQEILTHHSQALAMRSQAIDLVAAEMLKKLKWALFCQRRSHDSAVALEQRNAQQHRRNMLRYWAEQATRRRALRTLPLPESPTKAAPPSFQPPQPKQPLAPPPVSNLFSSLRLPSARKPPTSAPVPAPPPPPPVVDEEDSDAEMDFGATQRAEEWTSFDFMQHVPRNNVVVQQQQVDPIATPLPGYMRTPSKRTALAQARVKSASAARPREIVVSTTPAPLRTAVNGIETATPQVTPFQRKMQEGGYGTESTTPATFRRTRFGVPAPAFGRSGLGNIAATGRSVRFFDAEEDGGSGRDDGVNGV